MRKYYFIAFMILAIAGAKAYTVSGTTYTIDGSSGDFQNAVNATPSGGTIQFPSGTFNWSPSSTITVNKSLNIVGTGPGSCRINNELKSGMMLNIKSGTAGHIRLSGIYFYQAGGGMSTNLGNTQINLARSDTFPPSAANQWTVIVTNCTFDSGGQFIYSGQIQSNGVIMSGCTFTGGGGLNGFQITCNYGTNVWNQPDTMGSGPDQTVYNGVGKGYATGTANPLNVGDTAQGYMGYAGLNCTYIENCTMLPSGSSGSMNCDGGARVVFRYCTFQDNLPFGHGQDSSEQGSRHFEVYNCAFHSTANGQTYNMNGYVACRGAVMLVANNTFDAITYGNKSTIVMQCEQVNRNAGPGACQLTYPANRQCGIGWSSASSSTYGNPVVTLDGTGEASDPIFIWGNTGTGGAGYANLVSLNGEADECGNGLSVDNFIVQNRDYYVGVARPGWTPYTYPHPLLSGGGPTPTPNPTPAAPQNLKAE
jgi:hypothetical protein